MAQQDKKGKPAKQVWTTAELEAAGWTRRRISAAVEDRTLWKVAKGRYVTVGEDKVVLKALHRPGLTYTGATAAFLYGVMPMAYPAQAVHPTTQFTDRVITIRRRVARKGTTVGGMRVSTPAQTAVDLMKDDEDAADAADAAVRVLDVGYNHIKGSTRLAEDMEDLSRSERKALEGIRHRSLLGTASGLEKKALGIIRRALRPELESGEVTVVANAMVRGYCFDVMIKEARVLIEIDSYAYHGEGNARRSSFTNDRCKGNQAARWDWLLLRFACFSINEAPGYVGDEVADTVRFELRRLRRFRREDEAIATDRPMRLWHPAV